MFLLESPHRGDSNEYTQYTIFNMNKKNTLPVDLVALPIKSASELCEYIRLYFQRCVLPEYQKPAIAAKHGPHSPVRFDN